MGDKIVNINWTMFSECEKRKFEKMKEMERFVFFLLKQFGSPYGWGKENPETTDCSGAVCMALFAATGLLIRTTADDLLKRVFTKVNPRNGDIRAVFFITKKYQKHGEGYAASGTAVHVAGLVDDGIIFNASSLESFARVRRLNDVSDYYLRNGHDVLVRGLDLGALSKLAAEGKTVYELDKEFWNYFEK
jgi:murein DD-endopeptidase